MPHETFNNRNFDEEFKLVEVLVKKFRPCEKPEYIMDFIKLSTDDLHVSKLCYRKGYYAISVYHLQQAVEKSVKAYGLLTGIITIDDLNKFVKHDSPKIFLKLIKDHWEHIASFLDPKVLGPIGGTNFFAPLKEITQPSSKEEIANYTKKEIANLVKACDEIAQTLKQQGVIEAITSILGILNDSFGEQPSSKLNTLTTILIELVPLLYVTSIVTFPHVSSTRYPNSKPLNPKLYQKGLGIVDSLEILYPKIEEINSLLRRLYSMKWGTKQIVTNVQEDPRSEEST